MSTMSLDYLVYVLIVLACVFIMELVAIFTHKYIMHGPGWFLHESHHSKHDNRFELNDFYFVIFSSPSIFSIVYGVFYSNYIMLSIGFGILAYGLIYIFLHDILVHQRFGIRVRTNLSYLKKIRKAHHEHHRTKTKDGATNFGFITYFK
tara:strand:+ start:131 stop:577 length:447 start_codon:yes stop_codon:yes gene_type:complete